MSKFQKIKEGAFEINPAAPRLKGSLIQKYNKRKQGSSAYYGQN